MDFKFEEASQYEPVDNCRSVSLHNRRDKERVVASGELLIAWHHIDRAHSLVCRWANFP